MATTITKVRNGTITLPKELRKTWKGAEIYIDAIGDTIFIKRLTRPGISFKEMLNEFRRAARKTKLSKKVVEKSLRDVKKEIYA